MFKSLHTKETQQHKSPEFICRSDNCSRNIFLMLIYCRTIDILLNLKLDMREMAAYRVEENIRASKTYFKLLSKF